MSRRIRIVREFLMVMIRIVMMREGEGVMGFERDLVGFVEGVELCWGF